MLLSVSRRELYVLLTTMFLAISSFSIIFPLLPDLLLQFGASSTQMGLMVTVHAVFQFLFAPFWGSVSDRVGRKPVLLLGLTGFSISFILMGFATDYMTLLGARAMGGLLSASTFPTAQAYVADLTTDEDRGAAMGTMGASASLGFMMGPAMGGLLGLLGTQTAFFISAGMVAATALAGAFWLREPERKGHAGGPALGITTALVIALRSSYRLFYWLAFVISFCGSMLFGMGGYYLYAKIGGGVLETSLLLITLGAASALVQGLLVGRLTVRLGDERTLLVGLALGVMGFGILPLTTSFPGILLTAILTATGMSIIRPTIASAVSKRTTMEQGITMGIQSSFESLGRMFGPLTAGLVFTYHYDLPFVFAAAIYGTSLIVAARSFRGAPAASGSPPPAAPDQSIGT
ncbi:MAG: MFS transporter [Thermaerobacterales bacterium]